MRLGSPGFQSQLAGFPEGGAFWPANPVEAFLLAPVTAGIGAATTYNLLQLLHVGLAAFFGALLGHRVRPPHATGWSGSASAWGPSCCAPPTMATSRSPSSTGCRPPRSPRSAVEGAPLRALGTGALVGVSLVAHVYVGLMAGIAALLSSPLARRRPGSGSHGSSPWRAGRAGRRGTPRPRLAAHHGRRRPRHQVRRRHRADASAGGAAAHAAPVHPGRGSRPTRAARPALPERDEPRGGDPGPGRAGGRRRAGGRGSGSGSPWRDCCSPWARRSCCGPARWRWRAGGSRCPTPCLTAPPVLHAHRALALRGAAPAGAAGVGDRRTGPGRLAVQGARWRRSPWRRSC